MQLELQLRLNLTETELQKVVRRVSSILSRIFESDVEPGLISLQHRLSLSDAELKRIVVWVPVVLGRSYAEEIGPGLATLQSRLAMSDAELRQLVLSQPQVLGCNFETIVETALESLQTQLGLTDTELKRLALRNPPLLGRSYPESYTYLSHLKQVKGKESLLRSAERAASRVKPNPKFGSAKVRAQKHAAQAIDAYSAAITTVLRDNLKTFREHMRHLSPFEASMANLTLGAMEREKLIAPLGEVMSDFDCMRRAVTRASKEFVSQAAHADTAKEAEALRKAALESLPKVFTDGSKAIEPLKQAIAKMSVLPRVSFLDPTIVLVGMPNVGKSSMVTAVSSGTPEINDYPFTTRRLKIGHVITSEHRYQVMDTPGVLHRPETERNAMEGLTLAAVELLPAAVIFVMDLSGTCGDQSSPRFQLEVRKQIREQFPERPWLDVRSKMDLPLAEGLAEEDVPEGTLGISTLTGHNLEELKQRMVNLASGINLQPKPPPERRRLGAGAGTCAYLSCLTDVCFEDDDDAQDSTDDLFSLRF